MKPLDTLRRVLGGHVFPTVVFGALLVAALIYRDALRDWFFPRPAPVAGATSPTPSPAAYELSDASLRALRQALASYEEVRAQLADDTIASLDTHGQAIAAAVERAREAIDTPPPAIDKSLADAGAAARRIAAARDLTEAREAFGALSRSLVTLSSADPRLQEGQHIFECPMEKGYNKWLQPSPDLENPYMGRSMLECGGASAFEPPGGTVSHQGHGHEGDDVAFYTCPMHPSVRQAEMGKCPICGMDLTPVTFDEEEGGVVIVDALRRQRIGVRIGKAEVTPMREHIRTVGKLTYDETKLHDVTLKYKGWVEKLHANELGMKVKRGTPLFAVYSPEIYAAQGDLVTALAGPSLFGEGSDGKNPLVGMARERLKLLDAGGAERYLKKTGKPVRYVTVASPVAGYLVEKNVVDGSAFSAGERVMRIAGLDTVWIDVDIYESDLPLVEKGQRATVELTHVPGKRYEGKLTYIYPYLDPKTRTGKARIELKNPELALKPDMFANVEIVVDLGERLTIPESAVIFTGRRRLVFIDLGEGRLRPVEVELGAHADERYEVLGGLGAGVRVVTSGNFLIAAESRIRSAARYWGGDGASPEPPPAPAPLERSRPATDAKAAGAKSPPQGGKSPKRAAPSKPEKPEPVIYTCPMHPQIEESGPGDCPICGMQLVPKGE